MDFIERIFQISPDKGSGALETVCLMLLLVVPLLLVVARRIVWHREKYNRA